MAISDEELKPCPFCGSRSVYVEQIGSGGYFNVCCCNCLANVPLSGSRETAIAAWNCRMADVVSVKDDDLPKAEPMPQIPRIRYTDANGRVHEGWYAFHERRQVSPINDRLKPGDCMHCIVSDKEADWNLPRDIRVQAIVPDGGTVEVMRRFR